MCSMQMMIVLCEIQLYYYYSFMPTNENYKDLSASTLTITERDGLHENFDYFRALVRSKAHAWERHNSFSHEFGTMAQNVGFHIRYEPPAPGIGSRNRADIRIYDFDGDGMDALVDNTVSATDSIATMHQAAHTAGFVVHLREDDKISKYTPAAQLLGASFFPLAIEDAGFFGKSVHNFVSKCKARAGDYEFSLPESTTWAARSFSDYWYQRLSCKLVTGNAAMFRKVRVRCLGEPQFLGAGISLNTF